MAAPDQDHDQELLPADEPSVLSYVVTAVKDRLLAVQEYTLLCKGVIVCAFTPPVYVPDALEQSDIIGVGSLPIVLLTGFFIGMVMVVQTAAQFVRFGETSLTGDASSPRVTIVSNSSRL